MGWPMPLLGMSGNGAHAVYRCRLRANDELREALAAIYAMGRSRYSDDRAQYDPVVRIPRGSGASTGPTTPSTSRPQVGLSGWRPAGCRHGGDVSIPRALYRVAEACAKRISQRSAVLAAGPVARIALPRGEGDYSTLDAAAWFAAHGLYKRPIPGGKHAVICPWRDEHSDPHAALDPRGTDTVLFVEAGKWPGFFCSHAHCEGRRIGDVMALWGDADRYCVGTWRQKP